MNFYSLHVHDYASNQLFLDSTSKPKDIVQRARELQYAGMCITNHASISSYVSYLKLRDKIRAEGDENFKIMFGVEAYLIDENEYKNTRNFYHAIIIAKDRLGFDYVKRLVSLSWQRSYFERGVRRVPTFYQDIEALEEKGHLIFSSACLGSRLSKQILAHDVQGVRDFLSWTVNAFGKENVFLEMQPNDHSPEQKIVNDTILKLSKQTGLPYIITSDSHYTLKSDAPIHEAFLNSREAKGFREVSPFYDYTYLLEENEFYEVMGNMGMSQEDIRVGLENTCKVAEMVEDYDFRHHLIIPKIKIPQGFQVHHLFKDWYEKYPLIKKFAYDVEEQNRYMIYCMEERVLEKGYKFGDTEMERINTELEVLDGISEYHKQPMSAYLNLVKRIVDIIWKVSPVMPGRGSCSGFLCCHWLGITQLNPLDYNLPWFRFLNLGRIDDTPDIDLDADGTRENQIVALLQEEFGEDCVLHTMTYKTESLKSAILTACRGFGINNDEAQEMSSLVPVKRGKMPTLEGVENGDEDIGTPPVPQLIARIHEHEGLYEAIDRIQGLWSGVGIHASSLYIFQNGYLAQNALAIAPNGVLITAFDMHDSDAMGALKFDLLKTQPPQLFRKAMEYMVRDGAIEWQGSLRATWDKYLHPSVIDYSNQKLFENTSNGRVLSLFQFGDSPTGSVTIKKIQPRSIVEMALANDVMRLQGTINGETPTDRFVRYKYHPEQAIQEMHDYGLNDEEIGIINDHFGESYGVTCEQEQLMTCLLDKRVCGFSLRNVNNCRKVLAKKLVDKIPRMKEDFFREGEKCGARKIFLQYVWDVLLLPQLSYSFSRNHSVAYSAIGAIESWLVTNYNPLYWDAAVLSVHAGGEAQEEDSIEERFLGESDDNPNDEGDIDASAEVGSKKINTTNYGKIARGIGMVQNHGVEVALPDINRADMDFLPDVKNNYIIFGLGGIKGVNPDFGNAIINNRPYSSILDFITKVQPTTVQMINLVKAGCFDELYPDINRATIMEEYLGLLADQTISRKAKLTMANFEKLVNMGALPKKFDFARRVFVFKKWMDANEYDKGGRRYCVKSDASTTFFNKYIKIRLTFEKDCGIIPDGIFVKQAPFKKVCDSYLAELKEWMNSEEGIEVFYQAEYAAKKKEMWDKYCGGTISKWEMETLSYYFHDHELAHINQAKYDISNFENLPEIPVPIGEKQNREGNTIPIYEVKTIIGTVINVDNMKHIVTLLTNFGTVVDVKFYSGQFINLYKTISVIESNGKKRVIEKPWLQRGNLLLVNGFRRENSFVPRSDWAHGKRHSVRLITQVVGDELILKDAREEIPEEYKKR